MKRTDKVPKSKRKEGGCRVRWKMRGECGASKRLPSTVFVHTSHATLLRLPPLTEERDKKLCNPASSACPFSFRIASPERQAAKHTKATKAALIWPPKLELWWRVPAVSSKWMSCSKASAKICRPMTRTMPRNTLENSAIL